MQKTILITGATDGIGLETAKRLAADGHQILLHGRNPAKLDAANAALPNKAEIFLADMSDLSEVASLAESILAKHNRIDVVINNAGVLKTAEPLTPDGTDIRFMVNTIAPYLLSRRLLQAMETDGRIVNVASAAQAPVDLAALAGGRRLDDMEAYSQSKLAIMMWTRALAAELSGGPMVVSVNPGSLLASKMVKEGFGIAGNDLGIGVDILCRAALSAEFEGRSGQYFDNDSGRFAEPHPAAFDQGATSELMAVLDRMIAGVDPN